MGEATRTTRKTTKRTAGVPHRDVAGCNPSDGGADVLRKIWSVVFVALCVRTITLEGRGYSEFCHMYAIGL